MSGQNFFFSWFFFFVGFFFNFFQSHFGFLWLADGDFRLLLRRECRWHGNMAEFFCVRERIGQIHIDFRLHSKTKANKKFKTKKNLIFCKIEYDRANDQNTIIRNDDDDFYYNKSIKKQTFSLLVADLLAASNASTSGLFFFIFSIFRFFFEFFWCLIFFFSVSDQSVEEGREVWVERRQTQETVGWSDNRVAITNDASDTRRTTQHGLFTCCRAVGVGHVVRRALLTSRVA